jgi:type I restriction enzyme S subunit
VQTKLADLVRIKHGYAFKGECFVDRVTPYSLVTPGNFSIGGGFQEKMKYYDGPIPSEYVLKQGDLVVTMTDLSRACDTLGFAAVIPHSKSITYLHNQRVGLVEIFKTNLIRPEWLHYLMRSREYREHVIGSASGSTVKHSSPSRICDFQFFLPPVKEQTAVAEVLDTIEARIDILRQTNTTLESIAQILFKSWFIDFDPVRAKAEGREPEGMDAATASLFPSEFEETVNGAVPKGWRSVPVSEAFEINPKRVLGKGVEARYLEMSNTPTKGYCPSEIVGVRAFGSGVKFVNGDTLLAKITPCLENGKTAFVDFLSEGEVGWGSTEFIALRPLAPMPNFFGYLLARHEPFRQFAIQAMTGTSGRQRVDVSRLSQFAICLPEHSGIANAFSDAVDPLRKRITAADEHAKTLTQLRDTLLPRLISGKLRIAEAAETLESAVA